MNTIPALVFLIVLCSFWVLEIVVLRRWRGLWRWVALLPAVALAAVIINIAIGVLRDRVSHNLWPLELVMWGAGGLAWLGIVSIARRIFKAG
jgi:hypothetical protein